MACSIHSFTKFPPVSLKIEKKICKTIKIILTKSLLFTYFVRLFSIVLHKYVSIIFIVLQIFFYIFNLLCQIIGEVCINTFRALYTIGGTVVESSYAYSKERGKY